MACLFLLFFVIPPRDIQDLESGLDLRVENGDVCLVCNDRLFFLLNLGSMVVWRCRTSRFIIQNVVVVLFDYTVVMHRSCGVRRGCMQGIPALKVARRTSRAVRFQYS